MATAHLIYGYLGAGKTTFAKQLERDHNAVRFTHDEWMTALHGSDPPEKRFAEYAVRVSRLMEGIWIRVLTCGVDVVLDIGLWSRATRDAIRNTVQRLGCSSKLYWVCCSETVALERCRARNADLRGSLYIADATFEALKSRFEPLGDDEEYEPVATDSQRQP
jgi:predicted kinase